MRQLVFIGMVCIMLLTSLPAGEIRAQTETPPQRPWPAEAFRIAWERTDSLVATGATNYGWYWGPDPRSAPMLERDDDSPGGKRLALYFDKGRMEVPLPDAASRSTSQLTFGRLVSEMMSGNVQLGNQRLDPGRPAQVPVAGDLNDASAPTYASFARVSTVAPVATGQRPNQAIDRSGALAPRPELAAANPATVYDTYDDVTGHNIPQVFNAFLQRTGTVETVAGRTTEQLVDGLAVVGRPITEAYWVDVKLDGAVQPVLVQLFERRVLTYNPANPAPFQVEMGNAGLHYYTWRYIERGARVEDLLSHFEGDDQALNGNYWFSFDDSGDGGTSSGRNALIRPGVNESAYAMRFDYSVTTALEFSFAAMAINLDAGGAPIDLRNYSGIGFWVRGTSDRYSLRLKNALIDTPLEATFLAGGDWTWVEVPLDAFQPGDGEFPLDIGRALASSTRIEFRPDRSPSAGFIDIDDLVLIRGQITVPPRPELPFIDDFEDGDLLTSIDTEWFTYTDREDGGSSVAEIQIVEPGDNSSRALRFRGSFFNEWGPAYLGMGVPLANEGQTIDLSDYSAVEMSVRTDGQVYKLQMTSALIEGDNQYMIAIVAPAAEWTNLYIPLKLVTPSQQEEQPIAWEVARTQITNMIITPMERPEAFQLMIDNVRLVK